MKRSRLGGLATLVLLFSPQLAAAADMPLKAPPQAVAPAPPTWTAEFGARWFFSGQRYQKDLFAPGNSAQLNSRLTYDGTFGNSGELFGRVDSAAGLFMKAYGGIGWMSGGNLQDEDFPPALTPYSSTDSNMRNGRLGYAAIDLGFSFYRTARSRIGGFVGYFHLYEKFNGYGCTQTATNPDICVPTIADSVLILSETARWHALRVGLVGDTMITDRVKLTGEVAVLPYVRLDAFDNHWLRPDINPLDETGHGWGVQAEAIVSYAISRVWNVGIGGRYWHLETTSASTQFPGSVPSPMKFRSDRWGAFLQSSYRLN